MNTLIEFSAGLLGLGVEPKELTVLQICVRTVIVFVAGLAMLRFGNKRALSEKTAFDTVLVVILASVLARAVNGSGPFFGTLVGSFLLIVLHRVFGMLTCASPGFHRLVKGEPQVVLENGKFNDTALRQHHIARRDVEEDMRLSAKTDDISKIRSARIECSGDLSFIKAEG